ncbi:MAG: hypothetical protein ACJ796_05955 [Gemmatimonadaceae bacterium]
MRTVPVRGVGSISSTVVHQVADEVQTLLTLADVFAWARQSTPRRHVIEIVTQDEYTHDVILPFDGHFLVFDAT